MTMLHNYLPCYIASYTIASYIANYIHVYIYNVILPMLHTICYTPYLICFIAYLDCYIIFDNVNIPPPKQCQINLNFNLQFPRPTHCQQPRQAWHSKGQCWSYSNSLSHFPSLWAQWAAPGGHARYNQLSQAINKPFQFSHSPMCSSQQRRHSAARVDLRPWLHWRGLFFIACESWIHTQLII